MKKFGTWTAAAVLAGLLTTVSGAAMAQEIAVIVKTNSSNYWQNVRKGAEAAIKKHKGYTMTFDGPATETAISDEVNMVENAVNRGVKGIVLAPSDPEALVPAVKRAFENGIPVVIIDSALSDKAKPYYQSFLSTDNKAAGEAMAKEMIDRVGKTGNIAVMSYVPGVGSEIGRVGGFKDYIAKNSDLKVVSTLYSQSQMATALNQTTDVLSAHPDLKGIFGANEPTAVGMGRAIEQAGKKGQLVALGFDGNSDEQQMIKDGTLDAIAVQSSYEMGNKGVDTVIDLIEGKKVEPFVNTGVVIVTKKNIDSPEAKNVLY
ncbi:ABC transporter substrate-binding protein [Jiella sp. M17.18]|uniref:ABC transporter substrate-binding protein n=1 Tax=Jiella sp. M17.18 TaxID=3234247 RepID=UPI0034DE0E89